MSRIIGDDVCLVLLSCWQVWLQGVRQRCLCGSEPVLALGYTQKGLCGPAPVDHALAGQVAAQL